MGADIADKRGLLSFIRVIRAHPRWSAISGDVFRNKAQLFVKAKNSGWRYQPEGASPRFSSRQPDASAFRLILKSGVDRSLVCSLGYFSV